MRTWSVEELVFKAFTVPAVAVQAVLDWWAPPREPSVGHQIPGCPYPADCREWGCGGFCHEATEGRMECESVDAAEPAAYTLQKVFDLKRLEDDKRWGRLVLGEAERDRVWRHGDARMYRWAGQCWSWKRPDGERWRACTRGSADVRSLDGTPFMPFDTSLAAGATAAGDSPAEVSGDYPRPPSAGRSDSLSSSPLPGVDSEGPAGDSPISAAPAGHPNLTEVISGVLAKHQAWLRITEDDLADCRVYCYGSCFRDDCAPHAMCDDQQAWREHVAPLIADAVQRLYWKQGPLGEPVPIVLNPNKVTPERNHL